MLCICKVVKNLNQKKNYYENLALLKIAAEEQKHVIMIENLIEHISKPFSWIEDAEMSKKDPY